MIARLRGEDTEGPHLTSLLWRFIKGLCAERNDGAQASVLALQANQSLRPSAPLQVPARLGRTGLCVARVEWPGSTSVLLVFHPSAGLSFGL